MIDTMEIKISKIAKSKIDTLDFNNIPFGKVFSDHMFVAEYKEGEWNNFEIKPYEFLSLSPANTILHYGQSVFEGMKAYKNLEKEPVLFRPRDNWERLNKSAVRMCIPEVPEEVFMRGLTELIRIDASWVPDQPNTSLYVRPFIFASDDYIGIRPSETYKFIIFTCPVGAYYTKPVRVKIETEFSRAFEGGTGFSKTGGNYASSLYPAKLAQQQGYDQLIWTDGKSHQFVEESGTMNLIFVIDGKVRTAPTGDTILKGITRDSVLTLAKDWGYAVDERQVAVSELVQAMKEGRVNEAFGTGTAATIANIAEIGYDGVDYKLPELTDENLSRKVLAELDGLKLGVVKDKFDWILKV